MQYVVQSFLSRTGWPHKRRTCNADSCSEWVGDRQVGYEFVVGGGWVGFWSAELLGTDRWKEKGASWVGAGIVRS